jgi:hypothetical protein
MTEKNNNRILHKIVHEYGIVYDRRMFLISANYSLLQSHIHLSPWTLGLRHELPSPAQTLGS